MKSFVAVAVGVLFLVCTSLASSSVKLPEGFVIPEDSVMDGKTLYHTIANSLNTLPVGADLSHIATVPSTSISTLVGFTAKQRATLLVLPESLAPQGSVDGVQDNAFSLDEMSRTFSTAFVPTGEASKMTSAFAPNMVHMIGSPRMDASVSSTLFYCGVKMSSYADDDYFTLNGAKFAIGDMKPLLSTAAAVCGMDFEEQITVVDFRATYKYALEHYGADSAQIAAVQSMIDSVVKTFNSETLVFTIATDSEFYENQPSAYGFVAVSPYVKSSSGTYVNPGQTKPGSKDAGIFQIILWFVIGISLTLIVFAFLTAGVGLDIEKDTLLYQTTCLRGQPVF